MTTWDFLRVLLGQITKLDKRIGSVLLSRSEMRRLFHKASSCFRARIVRSSFDCEGMRERERSRKRECNARRTPNNNIPGRRLCVCVCWSVDERLQVGPVAYSAVYKHTQKAHTVGRRSLPNTGAYESRRRRPRVCPCRCSCCWQLLRAELMFGDRH